MSRQRRKDTEIELAVRRLLHASGLRYRVGLPVPLMRRRTIDIAFTRARVAVFLDGCFWHGCPEHATRPKANGAWWAEKLDRNIARDIETNRALEDAGWRVLRFWEHEPAGSVAAAIRSALTAPPAGGDGPAADGPAGLRPRDPGSPPARRH
ncbi:very short patch repair endonuclease [Kitasatospora sp. NE20-6]|uniref:very short patch repair endonuclease n=1 Tax=Kitasatospora sp. NE20-6 TaxID=2859066 RepID=UPI0038B2A162